MGAHLRDEKNLSAGAKVPISRSNGTRLQVATQPSDCASDALKMA